MAILIRLTTATETATYEGCALALTLATFGQQVQLMLGSSVFGLLMQPDSRLHGMIKSLDLYDLPPAWLPDDVFSSWLTGMVPNEITEQIDFIPEDFDASQFEQIFSF
ncbi:hypothetical protein [Psychrobacter sp. FDAARGOS_221]|uniref:hypothetical protein n=1 Tax=Psychrobacter sp. FDAARGOS_221 TaxID=1975705 RepID=UPI000BB5604E|nr:hypothetical protein [Psychrobacter sp. FDAARGOS_221]PNK59449.1 hypothetical protein A6J60_000120 [Psychrobacter sp. FDAARGOS_221]PNK61736.1 hypothetical protein A6J60_013270 [Psychrobacter sp. FDAARGOS_221]